MLFLSTHVGTPLPQVLDNAQRFLAATYPLFDQAALKVALAEQLQGPFGQRPSARHKSNKHALVPQKIIQGSPLLLEGSLAGPWSSKWRFAGGGVEWVVRCTVCCGDGGSQCCATTADHVHTPTVWIV